MTHATIDNSQDIMDSRDVLARLEELRDEREALAEALTTAESEIATFEEPTPEKLEELNEAVTDAKKELEEWDEENGDELKALADIEDELSDGQTLIRDSYFENYARQFAEDIGAIPSDTKWPCTCIDWKEAGEELQQDYSSIEFDGVTYWVYA